MLDWNHDGQDYAFYNNDMGDDNKQKTQSAKGSKGGAGYFSSYTDSQSGGWVFVLICICLLHIILKWIGN